MKKMVKRISALFLAMIMVLSMGISVFATGSSTVTINGGDNSLDGKTFSAYKLFDVTTAENDKYGYTPTADFEEWLKTQAGNSYSENDASLYDYVLDQMKAAGTAQTFLAALKTEAADQTAAATGTGSGNTATISGLSDGYYVIFCSDDSFSPNALTVTEDTTVYTKVTTPTIDKTAGDEDKEDVKVYITQNLGLETEEKLALQELLKNKWPDISFAKDDVPSEPPRRKVISGFLCLESSYDKKQAELKEINTVDMPQILKEINTARELGDLRENSEYQYAKEHKRELERRIGELTHDLTTVRIVKKEDVLPDLVGFGTKVTLKDNASGEELYYTFLGRWESRPEEKIIDINAPLGKNLINHKEGDEVFFNINGKNYDYTVLKIEVII